MTDEPEPTEDEQEPARLEAEEEMRGSNESDPDLPGADGAEE